MVAPRFTDKQPEQDKATTKPGTTKPEVQRWEVLRSMRKHSGVLMFAENLPGVSGSVNTILGTSKLVLTEIIVGRDGGF